LIEPTGLGHPKEVLKVLSNQHYQNVLSLQKTITLVDARTLSDERYTTNETYNQQIAIADIIIGNKSDLYKDDDKANLRAYIKRHGSDHAEVIFCQQGEIDLTLLQGKTASRFLIANSQYQADHNRQRLGMSEAKPLATELPLPRPIPQCGYIKATNQGEGFVSIGWLFAPEKVFDHKSLTEFLTQIRAMRMKAVFITNAGFFGYNLTTDDLSVNQLANCAQSRIEIIADSSNNRLDSKIDDSFEQQLLNCLA